MSWGGRRAGAGRPKKEKSDISPSHSIRAKEYDWDIIKPFACLVKMGYYEECCDALRDLIEKLDNKYPVKEKERTLRYWYLAGEWR